MSMSKKDFIALADRIKDSEERDGVVFSMGHLQVLADFCQGQNYAFKRERWVDYINGKCGPNGGEVKGPK